MSVRIEWSGLTEFLREFGSIPQQLHSDGMGIIREETEGAAVEISQEYARVAKTGTLAKRVRTEYPSTTILVGLVKSMAPHAHLYEFNHKKRGPKGGIVAGRDRFVPIARRRRDRVGRRMVEMLRRAGFQVGDE